MSEVVGSTPCPADFPFVYADGAYCCATVSAPAAESSEVVEEPVANAHVTIIEPEIVKAASDAAAAPEEISTLCLADFPYAYADGDYCSATGLYIFVNPEPIDKSSPSCQNNNFTSCPGSTNCENAFEGSVVTDAAPVAAPSEVVEEPVASA
ncbi:hypothetical protein SARC_08894 [Sphaeroforma arctica JP610]|uniref:Uncharacterized protein n=1 Tax=Sphaeroforma arctica JP610 TaxID=667725 RepID=A0A0L0FPP6_9EUKA|nr:hypothetical protein SARC_08894 [Sphaeroforma arctica JP610]KNC78684.1 hypothetical protein SARC_08894 [Sphaeroforma arctica JP610]|eukprot:XP_014152586.1 hypothetical protein SARC_08894 [Sphaeroforma arctica JP610]